MKRVRNTFLIYFLVLTKIYLKSLNILSLTSYLGSLSRNFIKNILEKYTKKCVENI